MSAVSQTNAESTYPDPRGVDVSAPSAEALASLEEAIVSLYSYRDDPLALIKNTLDDWPEFALAHIFRALVLLGFTERRFANALAGFASRWRRRGQMCRSNPEVHLGGCRAAQRPVGAAVCVMHQCQLDPAPAVLQGERRLNASADEPFECFFV